MTYKLNQIVCNLMNLTSLTEMYNANKIIDFILVSVFVPFCYLAVLHCIDVPVCLSNLQFRCFHFLEITNKATIHIYLWVVVLFLFFFFCVNMSFHFIWINA